MFSSSLHPARFLFAKPGFARLLLPAVLFFAFGAVAAQEQRLAYAIHRQGKKIGELRLKQVKQGATTVYNVESEVSVRLLLTVNVKAAEQSVYENEFLQSSKLHRTVNGREKLNKQIRSNGKGLLVTKDGKEEELKNFRVRYGMHCLYVQEPVTYTNVFSDTYETFLAIVKLAEHRYKISFPDGNSNEYHYENGVCKKVVVKSTLFDAEFVLMGR